MRLIRQSTLLVAVSSESTIATVCESLLISVNSTIVKDISEPKREDLTERLKKEFGLTVDEESSTAESDQQRAKDTISEPVRPSASVPLPGE